MRPVALLRHPWNTFNATLRQCEMMSVKTGRLASPAIYLIHLRTVQNKWRLRRAKAREENNVVRATGRRVGVSSSASVSVLRKGFLLDCQANSF